MGGAIRAIGAGGGDRDVRPEASSMDAEVGTEEEEVALLRALLVPLLLAAARPRAGNNGDGGVPVARNA